MFDCAAPISLLTIIMDTITVSGRMASRSCCMSIRPSDLTGKYVTCTAPCIREPKTGMETDRHK